MKYKTNDTLAQDVAAFPHITGKLLAAANGEGDADMTKAATIAMYASVYAAEYAKMPELAEFLGTVGPRLEGSSEKAEIVTRGIKLQTMNYVSGSLYGKSLSWSVGPRSEKKKIQLIPGKTAWMRCLVQEGKILSARKATAEDFANAPAFSVSNDVQARQFWQAIGNLHEKWGEMHEAGELLTETLPELPSSKANVNRARNGKGKNKSKGRGPRTKR